MDIVSNDPTIIQKFVELAKERDDALRALDMERAAHRATAERLAEVRPIVRTLCQSAVKEEGLDGRDLDNLHRAKEWLEE